jgi:hypothetical protein
MRKASGRYDTAYPYPYPYRPRCHADACRRSGGYWPDCGNQYVLAYLGMGQYSIHIGSQQ